MLPILWQWRTYKALPGWSEWRDTRLMTTQQGENEKELWVILHGLSPVLLEAFQEQRERVIWVMSHSHFRLPVWKDFKFGTCYWLLPVAFQAWSWGDYQLMGDPENKRTGTSTKWTFPKGVWGWRYVAIIYCWLISSTAWFLFYAQYTLSLLNCGLTFLGH